MFRRDELGFPSFWTLQIAGWVGFHLLVLVSILPELRKPGMLRANTVAVAVMFACSCLLHPICRSLRKRASSWIDMEVRAFIWCIPAGAICGLVCEISVLNIYAWSWADWIVSWMQSSIVLFLWCSLYFSIKQWQQSARERERLLRAEAEVRDARLSALRYQLNPHFLFNSLNAVSTLILEGDAPAATRMLAQIGDLLRSTLDGEVKAEIPLADEVAFTERYLAIEQTRLGHRLRVELDIAPDTLDALVPAMLLQPLVENAVRHGVSPLVQGGTIQIRSVREGRRLRLTVRNSGSPRLRPSRNGLPANGIGLRNTAERLQTLYPSDHKFDLRWLDTGGCEVTVELPFREAVQPVAEPEVAECVR